MYREFAETLVQAETGTSSGGVDVNRPPRFLDGVQSDLEELGVQLHGAIHDLRIIADSAFGSTPENVHGAEGMPRRLGSTGQITDAIEVIRGSIGALKEEVARFRSL